uniref:Putative LAGLIDADG homing endonuclease n=1 Tax=Oogamochlamys gigantea TaxID=158507 RepID=A0A0S2LNC0_9CHLO|nr:putative LAGLIDADG homing endonuclease [Oogamochlamys gigantea]ALO62830.1 putative LAGLIDADG homing endonuclease [Oogamochlamys gigantea]
MSRNLRDYTPINRSLFYCFALPVKGVAFAKGNVDEVIKIKTKKQNSKLKIMAKQKTKNLNKNLKFYQWLAGLIDGDGCFLVSSKGYTSLEITMGLDDLRALNIVKQKLGGSVKRRGTYKAYRYRLHHKEGMLKIINNLNGLFQNEIRIKQFKNVCLAIDSSITVKASQIVSAENGWFAGFFDADGTISIRKGQYPQLTISVSQKTPEILIFFKQFFGGSIRFDKSANCFKWDIHSKTEILNFVDYTLKYPVHSFKKRRLFLIREYFDIRELLNSRNVKKDKLIQNEVGLRWSAFLEKWEIG